MQINNAMGQRYQHHFLTHSGVGSSGKIPLLMVHGFLGDMFSWQYCIVPLSRYGQVFAIDLPGHGQSNLVWLTGLEGLVEWLEDAMDALGLAKCHLIAHSFGAWIALQAALRFSKRITSLTLVSCAGLNSRFNFPILQKALNVTDEVGSLQFAQILSGQTGEGAQKLARYHQTLLNNPIRRNNLQTMLNAMKASVSSSQFPSVDWNSLSMPIKFFWSNNDQIVPLPELSTLPINANLSVTNAGGHVPHILNSGWFTHELSQFLESSELNLK
jgi:pimeloyl-ACP methyl ester carboxylesterase